MGLSRGQAPISLPLSSCMETLLFLLLWISLFAGQLIKQKRAQKIRTVLRFIARIDLSLFCWQVEHSRSVGELARKVVMPSFLVCHIIVNNESP